MEISELVRKLPEASQKESKRILRLLEEKLSVKTDVLQSFNTEESSVLLREAIRYESWEVVDLIKNFGKQNFNYLEYGVLLGKEKIVEFLLKNSRTKMRWDYTLPIESLLHRSRNRDNILQLLISHQQLNIGYKNDKGENLLHILVGQLHPDDDQFQETSRILVDAGVSVSEVSNNKLSPLLLAIAKKLENLVALFLEANIGFENIENLKEYPLMCAARVGNEKIMSMLIEKGADVNYVTVEGWTVLHEACNYRNTKVVELLLLKGVNIIALNNEGRSAFSLISLKTKHCKSPVSLLERLFIKKYAWLAVKGITSPAEDVDFIEKNESAKLLMERCVIELHELKRVHFYEKFSLYSVLDMADNINELVQLLQNDSFINAFKKVDHKSCYKSDIQFIFSEALKIKNATTIPSFGQLVSVASQHAKKFKFD